MMTFQTYVDAICFLASNTDILGRLGITLTVSIAIGALFLDRFRLWLWVVIAGVFLTLTQWQINLAMHELGFTDMEIVSPHVITILSGILFVSGSGIGYYLKKKFALAYTQESPEVVAERIIREINGGATDESESNTQPLKF